MDPPVLRPDRGGPPPLRRLTAGHVHSVQTAGHPKGNHGSPAVRQLIVKTPQTSLRTANLDDADSITDLHTLARTAYYQAGGLRDVEPASRDARSRRRQSWLRAIQSGDRTVLCAEREGELVGILSMGPPHEAEFDATTAGQLYQIHVHPSIWGQGIGSCLHAAFVQFLRDASLVTGVLEAWERNSRAQAFYARHGWKPDGHRRPGPGKRNYVRMRLTLIPGV
ncbi:GNAT family N-acetyltransferase [Streptomyces sp. NPDC006332]|uniref:GNAT family N-acetyltransferase n=1 Tax=Streptomyces sp. NPDC006332 TaxID=3155456 RepID=UPI0033A8C8D3